jgi:hypothetical protein
LARSRPREVLKLTGRGSGDIPLLAHVSESLPPGIDSEVSLKRLAVGLVVLMVAISAVIWASGNMHAHRHHPVWVNVVSWLFAVATYTLLTVGVVTLRRRRRRHLG